MKKTFYYLALLMMVGTFVFGISSCGNDDEPKPNPQIENPDTPTNEPEVVFSEENPLMYVAEFSVNKRGNGFVKNHNLPSPQALENMDDAEVGYYNFQEAQALFEDGTHPFLANYYLPSRDQWRSLAPEALLIVGSRKFNNIQTAQVGETNPQKYKSDYLVTKEGDNTVLYSLRFKGTKWLSAWRYSYEGAAHKKQMRIQCIGLKEVGDKKFEDFANKSFFIKNKAHITERIFPAYGAFENNETEISGLGGSGLSFSSTYDNYDNGNGFYFLFSQDLIIVRKAILKGCYLSVRPFKKQP